MWDILKNLFQEFNIVTLSIFLIFLLVSSIKIVATYSSYSKFEKKFMSFLDELKYTSSLFLLVTIISMLFLMSFYSEYLSNTSEIAPEETLMLLIAILIISVIFSSFVTFICTAILDIFVVKDIKIEFEKDNTKWRYINKNEIGYVFRNGDKRIILTNVDDIEFFVTELDTPIKIMYRKIFRQNSTDTNSTTNNM